MPRSGWKSPRTWLKPTILDFLRLKFFLEISLRDVWKRKPGTERLMLSAKISKEHSQSTAQKLLLWPPFRDPPYTPTAILLMAPPKTYVSLSSVLQRMVTVHVYIFNQFYFTYVTKSCTLWSSVVVKWNIICTRIVFFFSFSKEIAK